MTKAANQVKTVRKRYSAQYKTEALALVERIGVQAATTRWECAPRNCMPGAPMPADASNKARLSGG